MIDRLVMLPLLLVDGYNVVAPIAPPGRLVSGQPENAQWLQRERMQLIQRLIQHLGDEVCQQTCVVFDAANPPPDKPSQIRIGGIEIRFAVGHPQADDLIEELIAAHSAPKRLAVVSSDHRIQAAAKRRGCTSYDSQAWFDDLMDGKVRLARGAVAPRCGAGQGGDHERDKPSIDSDGDVDKWMREFGFDEDA